MLLGGFRPLDSGHDRGKSVHLAEFDSHGPEGVPVLTWGLPDQFNRLPRLEESVAVHLDVTEVRPTPSGRFSRIEHTPTLIVGPLATGRTHHVARLGAWTDPSARIRFGRRALSRFAACQYGRRRKAAG